MKNNISKIDVLTYAINYINSTPADVFISFGTILNDIKTDLKISNFTLNIYASTIFHLLTEHNENVNRNKLNRY